MSLEPTNLAAATSTSDGSRYADSSARPLTDGEANLIRTLIDMLPENKSLCHQLTNARVEELTDGGMGSLQFLGHGSPRTSHEAITARSEDEDGVPVEIALNLDQNGDLFELDLWKVDFSPLRRLPEPRKVQRV